VPTPILIRRVTDTEGQVLFESEVTTTPAVSETTAFLMTTMLADVINAGTGYGARRAGFTLPAAGKTGTTNDYRDAWFVGFTPHLATGVWFGFDQPRTILANGFAGDVAVPVWADFMKAATREDEPTWVVPPDRVTVTRVCRLSGLLATEGCEHVDVVTEDGEIERRSMSYLEYFAPGTEPTGACDLHPTRGFFGSLAAAFTGGDPPAPPRLADAGLPEQEAEVAALVAPLGEGQEPTSPPKKKRGFWSRVFGIGRH
jgi:penicillin-binding protein 1A